jgi:hypothetical protein
MQDLSQAGLALVAYAKVKGSDASFLECSGFASALHAAAGTYVLTLQSDKYQEVSAGTYLDIIVTSVATNNIVGINAWHLSASQIYVIVKALFNYTDMDSDFNILVYRTTTPPLPSP